MNGFSNLVPPICFGACPQSGVRFSETGIIAFLYDASPLWN
jgi:hypothetical protein